MNNNIQSLPIDSLIIPAEMMYEIEAVYNSRTPSAFVSGLYYVSGDIPLGAIPAADLSNIPVGVQEHAISPGAITIVAPLPAEGSPKGKTSLDSLSSSPSITSNDNGNKDDLRKEAKKILKESAKHIALDAARKRVSRRLLLAERAKNVLVNCPETGIVSQLDIPAIPGFSLIYSHPLSELSNCRGIAQRGSNYLRLLDTQVLAGVLLTLSNTYELLVFQPFDSGAQKNAVLRTVGKDYLISAIIFIEDRIHSGNAKYLPKLSLIYDGELEKFGAEVKMQAYLKLLAKAIEEPDTSAYDSNYVDKTYRIRPVYAKKEESVSFLAKKELTAATKTFKEDKKAGKLAIGELLKKEEVTDKLRGLLVAFMQEDALLTFSTEHPILQAVVARLEKYEDSEAAKKLIGILTRDRRILSMDVSEIEDSIRESQEEAQEDDPAPGNEGGIEDNDFQDTEGDAYVEDMETEQEAEGKTSTFPESEGTEEPLTFHSLLETRDIEAAEPVKVTIVEEGIAAPEGLSAIEKILWLKKIAASAGKTRTFISNEVEGSASYEPSAKKINLSGE